jgi:hypothetical protein
MISPSAIVIDTSQWPVAMNAVILLIDAAILNWMPSERRKTYTVNLGQIAGPLATKQAALDRIVSGYRKLGWSVDYDRQQTTETSRVLVFELPD